MIRIGDEDVLHVSERRSAIPLRAQYGGRRIAWAIRARLRVGQVDQAVLDELRMQRDIEQAAESRCQHLRHRPDRRRVQHAVLDLAQPPRALGDEHAPIGKERDAPRAIDALGDEGDFHATAAAGGELPRSRAECVNRRRSASAPLTLRRRRPTASRGRSCRGLTGRGRLLSDSRIVRRQHHEDAECYTPRRGERTRPPP